MANPRQRWTDNLVVKIGVPVALLLIGYLVNQVLAIPVMKAQHEQIAEAIVEIKDAVREIQRSVPDAAVREERLRALEQRVAKLEQNRE